MAIDDVGYCVGVLAQNTPHEGFDPSIVKDMWPKLLATGQMKAAIVEDPLGEIVAFGASVFVTDNFVERLRANSQPLIGRQLMASTYTSRPSICTADELARGNANSGVNIFIIHSGLSDVGGHDVGDPMDGVNFVKAQLLTAFLELHRGYRVSRLMVEAYGQEERLVYEATSFRVLNNYSSFHDWRLLPVPVGSPRPCLFGISREQVMSMKTHILLSLFTCYQPACGFSVNEQRLLQEALEGHTDEELALILDISLSAIKKQWIRIFEKTERNLPGLVFRGGMPTGSTVRGLQRRHVLLRAIRSRPEELTPHCRSRLTVCH
jgi:hypothetical protein